MRAALLLVLAFVWTVAASGMDTAARVAGDADGERVLARRPIKVQASGHLDVPYLQAMRMLSSTSLLADVQAEYARLLPPGEAPEFVITQAGPAEYFYVNKSGQESHIRELHRAEHDGPVTEVVFYTKGRRFFGEFEAVIHIAARPQGEGAAYETEVFAYPQNAFSRFFARHLRLVSLYFHSKTDEIEDLSVRICRALCGGADVASR
jgi:hypothetical protein